MTLQSRPAQVELFGFGGSPIKIHNSYVRFMRSKGFADFMDE
jgi:hypothetical protein